MNKRGIMDTVFWTPLLVILYIFLWIFMFGPIMGQFGAQLADNSTGIESFLWRTLNIWAGFIPLLIFLVWKGTGGGQ